MSVLIKDMEMPTSCTMCWLNTFCGVWNTEPVPATAEEIEATRNQIMKGVKQ